jgi:rare lipoprotein A (peptidoglycan hydrolase)
MPLRHTIGFSLALIMASTGAMAKAPEKSAGHHHVGAQHRIDVAKSGHRSGKHRFAYKARHSHWRTRLAFHRGRSAGHRHLAMVGYGGALPDWGPMHVAGAPEIGAAAWYALVGSRTSSGERLDTVTATAAHRSLPLGSCAKVTSLDTGRSVIVKINDRGPYNRRFIIDLSPRAAEELGMIHAGTAAVAVEPVAAGPATVAVNRTSASNLTQ